TGGAIAPLLALSGYKYVFPSSEGEIIFFDNKEIKWKYKLDSNNVAASGLCADKKQNIYILDNEGELYSLTVSGKLRWKKFFKKISDRDIITFSDLMAVDDGIIVASSDGLIVKYNFKGELLWSKLFNLSLMKYFPADEKGNIYLPLTNNTFGESDSLVCINSRGDVEWERSFEKIRIIKPAVCSQSDIYLCCVKVIAGERYPLVICLSNKGKIKWNREISQTARFISVGNDGNIYVVAYDAGFGKPISMIISFDKDGKMIWKKNIEVAVISPVMIGEEIISFVGTDEEASGVYFMRKNGFLENVISLSEAPILNLNPLVTPNKNILFGGSEKIFILRIDETPLKKFIPW
ncbi:hypothetical protein D9V86_11215, partial [Bacteroidetes/Chlorobi group bacterium ChocPot_Mid]